MIFVFAPQIVFGFDEWPPVFTLLPRSDLAYFSYVDPCETPLGSISLDSLSVETHQDHFCVQE